MKDARCYGVVKCCLHCGLLTGDCWDPNRPIYRLRIFPPIHSVSPHPHPLLRMAGVLYNTAGALLSYLPYIISTSSVASQVVPPPPPPTLPYAHHNLRHYVSTAIIPDMELASTAPSVPEAGSISHANHLKVQHESHRVLESMERIDDFKVLVRDCMSAYIHIAIHRTYVLNHFQSMKVYLRFPSMRASDTMTSRFLLSDLMSFPEMRIPLTSYRST